MTISTTKLHSTSGSIAASDPQTVQAGAEILQQGGNAVDAAVAAALASFVIEYPLVNIGASGVATVVDGATGNCVVYDFFSNMPSAPFTAASDFREITVNYGPTTQPFYIGRASVAVPGAVAGLSQLAADHGRLPLAKLFEPAIRYAYEGVELMEAMLIPYQLLQPIFNDTSELAAIYLPNGRPTKPGERIKSPQLGATLEQLSIHGASYFYRGALAERIIVDQQEYGGLLTAEDLTAYEVYQAKPISIEYRDFTILLPPPSSTGGLLTAFALMLLGQQIELSTLDHNSAAHIRVLAEVMRQTNIARAAWEADTAPPTERVERFLAPKNIAHYAAQVRAVLDGATPATEPVLSAGPSSTTHISVADHSGNVVSITTSAGETSGYVVGDTGVSLNNMLGEVDLHPGGFHQTTPGQRLSTMMTPAVVLKGGKPLLAIGSGGANRIRTAILQSISNVLDFGMDAHDAVNAPRIHFEEDVLQLEGGVAPPVAQELSEWGYKVNAWEHRHMFFGGAHIVLFKDGQIVPAGDLRRGGSVAVV